MIDYEGAWREFVLPDVFASVRPDAQPLLVLVGGQPGCGKTAAVSRIRDQNPGLRFAQIVGDDLRQHHPDDEDWAAGSGG
ncbi:MAG: zeta toxin family protein [Bifidobacteriaceae bacterium]|jgi:hypothetical protein|nr:zeta toxin family protein [Bifidobacteriaceae bacterium]